MTTTKSYDETDNLTEVFVGRRIVSVDNATDTFTLDNGAVVQIVGNEGCGGCGSGWYSVDRIASTEHVITGVSVSGDFVDEESEDERYTIVVYSAGVPAGEEIATISGNDGNGYYGTGFTINVALP